MFEVTWKRARELQLKLAPLSLFLRVLILNPYLIQQLSERTTDLQFFMVSARETDREKERERDRERHDQWAGTQ